MTLSDGDLGGKIKRRSGWMIPLTVFVVTATLSAMILAYYLAPTTPELMEEQPAPTDDTGLVALHVGKTGFHIPANYLPFASTRKSERFDAVSLVALLPGLQGYALNRAQDFADAGADSHVVNMKLRSDKDARSEEEQLQRIYMPQVVSPDGTPAMYGLTHYAFKPGAGYPDEELFVGMTNTGIMVLRCNKPGTGLPAPSCLRDLSLGNGIALSYRFKRSHLEDWRQIDADIRALAGSFMDTSG
jgi:hypothetical protein